jgi:hypothetical protein
MIRAYDGSNRTNNTVRSLVAKARDRAKQELQDAKVALDDSDQTGPSRDKVIMMNCAACDVKY